MISTRIIRKSKCFSLTTLIALLHALCLFLLAAHTVSAFQISPAIKTVDFTPDASFEQSINIINSENNDFSIGLSANGELRDIFFFENPVVNISKDSYITPVKYVIRFPSELSPGTHRAILHLSPVIASSGSENVVTAFVSFDIPVLIRVPYPSKYADISISVMAVDEGTPVPIYARFDNLGSEDILKAGASLDVYDTGGSLMSSLVTDEISVKKGALGEAQARPAPILKKGLYRVVAKANYDGIAKDVEANFSIGEPLVRIKGLITTKLVRNQINKITFTAANEWNTELVVNGNLELNKVTNELPVFSLKQGEEKQITGFFDTAGINPGEYTLGITLTYANQVKTVIFPVTITEKPVQPEQIISLPLIIILAILILAIAALIIFLFIKKRKVSAKK
jgi:hypothetical protein